MLNQAAWGGNVVACITLVPYEVNCRAPFFGCCSRPILKKAGLSTSMKVLVTGAAGFIGFYTAKALLDRGDQVVGLDNLNDYYDPSLKQARLGLLEGRNGFHFIRADLSDRDAIDAVFAR